MGRRKERRLAAKSAAGRRVKLDLSVEPAIVGEVEGTLSQAKVGGDNDQEERTGAPTSPSSSGQKQDNPLFLLGQYSDDEVEDKAGNKQSHISEEISSVAVDVRVGDHVDHNEDNNKTGKDAVSSIVKFEVDHMDAEKSIDGKEVEINCIVSSDPFTVTETTVKTSIPDASAMQTVKDASSGWKIVMDEESKQYYYWNTLTGQTSWEAPDILTQSVATSSEQMISLEEHNPSNESLKCNSNVSTDNGSIGLISNSALEYMNGSTTTGHGNTENANVAFDACQIVHNFMTSNGELCIPQGDEERNQHFPTTSHEAPPDIQLDQLVLQCETLLQKLKALECHTSEEMSKYASEVETRLLDCKALSSFGSSVLPFWRHTKAQLDRLEIVIEKLIHDNAKFEQHIKKINDDESFSLPAVESEVVDVDNKTVITSEEVEACNADVANDNKKDNNQSLLPAESSCETSDREIIQVNEMAPSGVVEYHVSQDIDMDVEMEVDEETPSNHPAIGNSLSIERLDVVEKYVQPNPPPESVPSTPSEDLNIPPPPDEEWIPPPPPDDEPIPPFPPEDAPSVSPIPYGEASQNFSYTDQYNLGYSIPTFQYYTPAAAETQGTHYYASTDVTHVAEPQHIQQYYEQPVVSNSYTRVSAEPVLYYNLQNGTPAPTVLPENTIGEMGNTLVYPHTGSFGLPTQEAACEVVNVTEEVHIPTNCHSFTASAKLADATSTVSAKNPSKGPSKKKRSIAVAPTFRSNKKVSNLVDKWNAAKELLHEDEEEEEPDNAYEALEKKRQKEIEEWRAQQVASGEALDNANFLPLGGDWRKRVKRKRARSNAAESTTIPLEEDVNDKKPDLVELSKGLPSAWKVYLDESSNEVYYGNLYTSETTWTRPSSS